MRPALLNAALISTVFAFAGDAPLSAGFSPGLALAQVTEEPALERLDDTEAGATLPGEDVLEPPGTAEEQGDVPTGEPNPEAQVVPSEEPAVVEPLQDGPGEGIGGGGETGGETDVGDVGTDAFDPGELETEAFGTEEPATDEGATAQAPVGFGGNVEAEAQAAGQQQQQQQEQAQRAQQALQELQLQQQAMLEQQQAIQQQQEELAARTEALQQLEEERAAELQASREARAARIAGYGETVDLLIQADTALVSGELDVNAMLEAAIEQLGANVAIASEQGRTVEAQLAEGARAEVMRAAAALEERDVYPARRMLQNAGVLLDQAQLDAAEAQPTAAQ